MLQHQSPSSFRAGIIASKKPEPFYLGGEATNADRIAALIDECTRKKEEKPLGRVGFN